MSDWIRVSRGRLCPVCKHQDWCCIGRKWINCMRVSSPHASRNGGWLHPIEGKYDELKHLKPEPPKPTIHARSMMRTFYSNTDPELQEDFANRLGVSLASLIAIGCAWAISYNAWAFPMWDDNHNMVGIRLRNDAGRKWAVQGSREGIFIAQIEPRDTLWIVEGPTDLAAALTLGLFAVGRPTCLGGVDYIVSTIKRWHCRRAVIVSDNDGPGSAGAVKLALRLPVPNCVCIPPCKDIREFLAAGGTEQVLTSIVDNMLWTLPT